MTSTYSFPCSCFALYLADIPITSSCHCCLCQKGTCAIQLWSTLPSVIVGGTCLLLILHYSMATPVLFIWDTKFFSLIFIYEPLKSQTRTPSLAESRFFSKTSFSSDHQSQSPWLPVFCSLSYGHLHTPDIHRHSSISVVDTTNALCIFRKLKLNQQIELRFNLLKLTSKRQPFSVECSTRFRNERT